MGIGSKCRAGSDLLTHCDYAWIASNGPRACIGRGRITLGHHHDRHAHRFPDLHAPFFEPVEQMAHWFAELQMAQASAERILSLINETPTIRDSDS